MSETGLHLFVRACARVHVHVKPETALVMPKRRDKEVLKCQGTVIALC